MKSYFPLHCISHLNMWNVPLTDITNIKLSLKTFHSRFEYSTACLNLAAVNNQRYYVIRHRCYDDKVMTYCITNYAMVLGLLCVLLSVYRPCLKAMNRYAPVPPIKNSPTNKKQTNNVNNKTKNTNKMSEETFQQLDDNFNLEGVNVGTILPELSRRLNRLNQYEEFSTEVRSSPCSML